MLPVLEQSLACPRCHEGLGYSAQPCRRCLAPATFDFKQGEAAVSQGALRGTRAQGRTSKRIRVPVARRAVAALRMASVWTLHSLTFALLAHALLLAMLLLITPLSPLREVTASKFQPDFAGLTPPAPLEAPEKNESLIAAPDEETTISPEQVFKDLAPGSEDYKAPEEKVFAPEPEVAPPMPSRATELPRLPRNSGAGLGEGQRTPSAGREFAGGGLYKNRSGNSRAAALRRHGGDSGTENAVNLGLAWLASVQSSDGSWDPTGRQDTMFDSGINENWGAAMRTPVSALCVLPFLAAGHTPEQGEFSDNVRRALEWLLRQQQGSGSFDHALSGIQMYTHGVATLAMCEAYGLTGDERLKRSAERAVRFLERTQSAKGGWDYRGEVTDSARKVLRNDLSIAGWAVLALKSARAVGIGVSENCWKRMSQLYGEMTLDSGETYYADKSPFPYRKGIAMTGVGLTARVILDREAHARKNVAAMRLLAEHRPNWSNFLKPNAGSHDPNFDTFYGWYYCTLGLFLATDGAGPDWEGWNAALKPALLQNQELEVEEHKGSWDPVDSWIGPVAGRLYSTACAILCLEVYYRYSTARLTDAPLTREPTDAPPASAGGPGKSRPTPAVDTSDMSKPANRARALRAEAKEKGLGAAAAIIHALRDDSSTVRFTALSLAADLKAREACQPILDMLGRQENADLKSSIAWALGKVGDKKAAGTLIGLLKDSDKVVAEAARTALSELAGGKDYGTNAAAWRAHFEQ
ncbi:MAG: hypothetical protein DPW14_01555 [Planctomycetes bacterium]|nr:hypothetical protein [Planctomycetota bacterium]